MSRPFAVFDIDGTLIRWQLYHAVVESLVKAGHISTEDYAVVREARMVWKRRASTDAYRTYEDKIVEAYDAALKQASVAQITEAIERAFSEYKDQTYTYTRDLITTLRKQGYLLFAISASQEDIVGLLARHYHFDDFGGTSYEQKDGRFTGSKHILKRDQKPIYVKKLVEKHGASWQGSIAVGDSESDIPMLETVEQPIAFNPTKLLFTHASAKDWKVVIERKNVVYELARGKASQKEGLHGPYILEKTNS